MAEEGASASTEQPSAEKDGNAAAGATHTSSDSAACIATEDGPKSSAAGPDGDAAARQVSSSATKYALHHAWCLWALLRDQSTKDNWHGSQMLVGEFDSVEDFWRHFNNIRRPSKLGTVDFSMFKKDIAPAWEDETCKNGGRWIAKLEGKTPAKDFDELWFNLVLHVIGENFEKAQGGMVCGVVVSARAKGSGKVALWVSERGREKVMPIGHAFAAVLHEASGFNGEIVFEDFSEGGKAMFSLKDR